MGYTQKTITNVCRRLLSKIEKLKQNM